MLPPEMDYEGASLPLRASRSGASKGPSREVRDPYVFQDEGRLYLFYSVAGESGIGLAELRPTK